MTPHLTVAFDADDTLWHNENVFAAAEDRFNEIVAPWADADKAQRVLIDGAGEAMRVVSEKWPTMIITKGDLHHQLRRIDQADVGQYRFDVEVVADKDAATYKRILQRHRIEPENLIMVGNSIVSDVAPLLETGARSVHIPYEFTWALETATQDPEPSDRWFRLESISALPDLIESLS